MTRATLRAAAALALAAFAAASAHAADPAAHAHPERLFGFARLEGDYARADGADRFGWEAEGWAGNDRDRAWFKTEGETHGGDVETAEFQALYSRNVWTFFDVQGGLRVDTSPDSRGYAVIGLQGLAPYLLETELHAFVGFRGDVSLRLRQSFDLRLTNRLILEPGFETELHLTDVPERRIASGFSHLEAGVQARYELSRRVAPTLALVYEGSLGETARLARADGEDPNGWTVRAGLRLGF